MPNELKNSQEKLLNMNYIRVHHSWYTFIKYCESMGYGEIEKLRIQDGLPLLAEEVKKKVKFL